MTFKELVELAKTYNARGTVPKDAPKEVVVFDVADQTASVKVTAVWGIDYMHLGKYDGKWKIINILWQSPPRDGAKQFRVPMGRSVLDWLCRSSAPTLMWKGLYR